MRLLDPGFESGGVATPWMLAGSAEFLEILAHQGMFSMALYSSGSPLSGIFSHVSQVIPTTPGEILAIAGWFYGDAGAKDQGQEVEFLADTDPGDGSALKTIGYVKPTVANIETWGPHIFPGFQAEASQAYLRWLNPIPTSPVNNAWFVDDLLVVGDDDVAKRSRLLGHNRLLAVLAGINGAPGGYHTNLAGRVFNKYIRPVGSTHPALPYICVPLVNTAPRVQDEGTFIRHTWTLPIMAFVAESNVGAFTSDAIGVLYHLGEDIYKAVLQDQQLAGTVRYAKFVDGGVEEGGISPFDGLPYADAVIPIELSIDLGLDVLGP